jgi:NAD+ dependent glucose-6-phosphate dehydrogenase
MSRRLVLITGVSGNLGTKLRHHFEQRNAYDLRLLCLNPENDPAIHTSDLSVYDESWAVHFADVNTVIHLAGDRRSWAGWDSIQKLNIDLSMNVFQAALRYGVRRMIFASSNWVMGGYRFGSERLTTSLAPWPVNPYGHSKLFGERVGRSLSEHSQMSFIGFRVGYCQPDHDNQPGRHMNYSSWGQGMWLSDRDLCHGVEQAVLAENVKFAILNLMSDNPGMRWDIEETKRVIGFQPRDGYTTDMDERMREGESLAKGARTLADQLNQFIVSQRL